MLPKKSCLNLFQTTLIFLTTNCFCRKNRFIGESGMSISDITEISDWCNIKGFLVAMEIRFWLS